MNLTTKKGWQPAQYAEVFRIITNKLREGGVEVATVFNAGLSGTQGIMNYYPGSEYVDWMGFNTFSWDIAGGQHSIINEFASAAAAENKPFNDRRSTLQQQLTKLPITTGVFSKPILA